MAEAAEVTDDFDAEVDAARVADAEFDDHEDNGAGDDHLGEGDGDGEAGGEGEGAQARQPLDPQTVERRWRDTQKALKEERRTRRSLEDRLAALEQGGQRQAPAQGADEADFGLPNPMEDPIGWMQQAQKLIDRMQGQERETAERQQRETAQQRQMTSLQARVQEHEDDFRADHPDYDDATKFLKQSVAEELTELGLAGPALQAEFESRLVGMVTRALQAGKDPAEVTYALAKKRGFSSGKLDNGSASLQKIAAGQKASRTLGGGGSRPVAGQLDARSVADLKGAAFDAAFEKLAAQERRRR